MTAGLHQRPRARIPRSAAAAASEIESTPADTAHPAGDVKHGRPMQALRGLALAIYFASCCTAIHLTQWIGAPLYFVNRDLFYAYMALTKQSFGLLITTITHWWSPTLIRISGDGTVADQIRKTADGLVEFSFPERLVLIANHQLYTDWLYLWWVGYANRPKSHGSIYIILKESLKYIPVIGPGMIFYGFIFMSRKMAVDQPRMARRLRKLSALHTGPGGKKYLDPMWLLLFPEGTNASGNGRARSAKWAEETGVKDTQHMLLPRSTGMFFCLNELKNTVEYVYDCTVAYEGVPRGRFGEEFFSIASTYFQGRPPRSVNFHWRRFRIADMPLDDRDTFDEWLRERWYEKDALMEQYMTTGRFPPFPQHDEASSTRGLTEGFIETEVRTTYWFEFIQIFVILGIFGLLWNTFWRTWSRLALMIMP